MSKLIKTLVSLVFVPVLFAAAYQAYLFVLPRLDFDTLRWLVYGAAGYLVVALVLSSRMEFAEIFEHELAHLLVALLFFQRVQTFFVSTDRTLNGGLVGYRGTKNFFIALAPYFLPVFALPFLALKVFFPAQRYLDVVIGVTLAFFYVRLFKQFRLYQPDISNTGLTFSLIIAGVLNAVVVVLILCIVRDDYSGLRAYFVDTYDRSLETFQWIAQQAREARQSR